MGYNKENFKRIRAEYETKAFISGQVERFSELFGSIVYPALERLCDVLENMDEKTVDGVMAKFNKITEKLF